MDISIAVVRHIKVSSLCKVFAWIIYAWCTSITCFFITKSILN